MFAAHVLRVIQADRIVVSLDHSLSVIELQLSTPLSPEVLAKARSFIEPCKPVAVQVSPGNYRCGVFWGSYVAPLDIPSVERPRADYRARRVPA
jgi:hypothetical protein